MKRTSLSTKNAIFALVTQFFILIGQFVLQTVFVNTLSARYLGANGLFTNLVSFLSFAELGIGSAITYSLYGPLANNNYDEINAIMTLFKKVYRIIGFTILFSGLILSLFINDFVKSGQSIPNLQGLFILYLLSTVVSYFFTYTRSLIIANQDGYINSTNQALFKLLQIVCQLIVLLLTKSYWLFLIIMIISNLGSNIRITRVAFKKYTYLRLDSKVKVDSGIISRMKQNVVGTVSSKIGEIVVFGTDNVLISKFIGLTMVGIYSNYTLIINGINSVISQGTNALISSFGNLGATEDKKYQKEIFFDYLYLISLVTYVVSATFFTVVRPFITIWFGSNFVLPEMMVLIITINFCLTELRQATLGFVSALGLFWPMRYKSLIEAALNLGLSLFFMLYLKLGLLAVLLGTLLSTILINLWWEPLVLFKIGFNSRVTEYFARFIRYFIVIMVTLLSIYLFGSKLIRITNFFMFLIYSVVMVMLYTLIFICIFYRTNENKYFLRLISNMAKKLLNKN